MSNRRDGVSMDVKVDETLQLQVPAQGGVQRVTITLEAKSGQVARLRIKAEDIVRISRTSKQEAAQAAG